MCTHPLPLPLRLPPQCASDINDEVTQYNLLYQSYFGFASTISQIMSREVDRVLRSTILGLYGASHMFHQVRALHWLG
jgi:hypothetical protein